MPEAMMALIMETAREDERVRAAALSGSRAAAGDSSADLFSDFDIIYFVENMEQMIQDRGWLEVFGEPLIMQTPDEMNLYREPLGESFAFLMLFQDGNRIDLTLKHASSRYEHWKQDGLTRCLLDKDNPASDFPAPTDIGYKTMEPEEGFFQQCCNEFWWVAVYVVKGWGRREMLYAQAHLNIIRRMLVQMLQWKVVLEKKTSVNFGQEAKYLEKYLGHKNNRELAATYAAGSYDSIWASLQTAMVMFERESASIADKCGFALNEQEGRRVKQYIKEVKRAVE
ncbi:aminoglycoside 6-adenylyltransferase [Marinococcus luteus]|uniref:aminoglycoside 6-adenylyltransferase n=1 Tax=Marinococcus luteus TaxID=1122204 RepID=UPI002ACCD13A|nr:aminoglycoside 6-adenylyltransferase [Marinococcus luteus]MDZ5783517.1 aminoglycoside 6-adenylyltransferase [Marinococcus luteus]